MNPSVLVGIDEQAKTAFPGLRSVLIVRHGYLVVERYYGSTASGYHKVFSVTKSMTSAVAGIALADHRIRSLHQTVASLIGWRPVVEGPLSGCVDRLEVCFYDRPMPVCQRCGEDNPERARFCLACAAPLAAPAVARREERKRVSVLFCDLVGFTSRSERLDVEDVRAVLAPYYARLRADLERYGGTVEKFIGDAVMALFGAPTAHEDDPERAVRAALAIRAAIAELNQADPSLDLHVRVGVTTGEALVALDARPVQGEGMASGDVVNTAARLQTAAPVDGILVDQSTYRATDRQITYQSAEPVQAKGKTDPVAVWLAIEARASLGVDVDQAPQTVLVGRQQELDLLGAALARVRGEHALQLVTLVGVPGMGKSRLVWELKELVEAERELTIWRQGRCLPYGEGVALWALGEIVKAQAGILETDPAELAQAKLNQVVADLIAEDGEAAWVTGHLRPLVGLAAAGEAVGDRRAEAFAAWRRFLEALAEQGPTVVVVEDLHWADEVLLDFLDHLTDWAADVPLLVVCTARPELLSRRPGWAGGKLNAATIALSPLSEADTARLVAALLGQALLPAELQTILLARAGGNPLYAEEYVRMLADRGFLRKTGGSWQLERADQLPLPESVQGIIAARLDALGSEEKALLQDAAVLGKVGWVGALAALGGAEPFALEQSLHALERRELLRRERRSAVAGERQYAFRHVLVRDVAYAQLPRATRATKHQQAAHWLQALAPDRAEDRAELLAHHWQAALQYAQAAGLSTSALAEPARLALRQAGDHALKLNAFATAARWYTEALELWPTGDRERPRLLLRLGQARMFGEQASTELLAEARDGLLAQGDREAAAEAEARLGLLTSWQGQGERAMEHARRAVTLLADAGPSPTKVYALFRLAQDLMLRGETAEAIQVGRQALVLADRLELKRERVGALQAIGGARVLSGDLGGITDLEQAIDLAIEHDPQNIALAYGNLANTLIALGELARGFQLQAKARPAAERLGLTSDLRWLDAERIFENYWRGHWDAAGSAADQFIAEPETGTSDYAAVGSRLVRGWIRLARGDLRGALQDADAGLEHARVAKEPQVLYPMLAFRGRALLAVGRPEEVGADASELLAMLAQQGVLSSAPDWSGDLAVVLEALGRGAELLELLADAKTRTRWLEAAAAVAAGESQRAADLYDQIEAQPEAAYARLQAAKHLVAAGRRAEANAQLSRALAVYRQVTATGYLREGETLLTATA
jgi:class 3 adenylate cyclase